MVVCVYNIKKEIDEIEKKYENGKNIAYNKINCHKKIINALYATKLR